MRIQKLLDGLDHRHPGALEQKLEPIIDLLDAGDVAYLVNVVRAELEKRIEAEKAPLPTYGENWLDLLRLIAILLKRLLIG